MPDEQGRLWGRPPGRPICRSRTSVEKFIAALRAEDGLKPPDALLVALLRTAADVADETRADDAGRFHHHQALRLLADLEARARERAGAVGSDAFESLLVAASGTAAPRNAAD